MTPIKPADICIPLSGKTMAELITFIAVVDYSTSSLLFAYSKCFMVPWCLSDCPLPTTYDYQILCDPVIIRQLIGLPQWSY